MQTYIKWIYMYVCEYVVESFTAQPLKRIHQDYSA